MIITNKVLLFNMNQIPCHYRALYINDLYRVLTGNLITDSYFFMQWMFPSQVKSKWNTHTKLLTQEDMRILRNSDLIKTNILNSTRFILNYFRLTVQNETIIPQVQIEQSQYWLQGIGHEEKKLSRIMHCLKLCGFAELAENLQEISIKILIEKGFKTGKNSQEVVSMWKAIFKENKLY